MRRQSSAALVSRRWRRLCSSPQLLRSVSMRLGRSMEQLRAACAWLHAHAAAIDRLELQLEMTGVDYTEHSEAEAALAAACASCGTAGQLRELRLSLDDMPLCLGSWAAALTSVQRLGVTTMDTGGADCPLTVSSTLECAKALQELWLFGNPLVFPELRLPASQLTKLELAGLEDPSLLNRLCGLSKLHHLSLVLPLTFLRGLRILKLAVFEKDFDAAANTATLDAALAHLTRLTRLQLQCLHLSHLPPSLARMPCLQQFGYDRGSLPSDASLPSGPWLASLCRLLVPAAVLANSRQQLLAAPRLECLGCSLHSFSELSVPQQLSILSLAADLPALTLLGFGFPSLDRPQPTSRCTMHVNTVAGVAQLVQRLPNLRFDWESRTIRDLIDES